MDVKIRHKLIKIEDRVSDRRLELKPQIGSVNKKGAPLGIPRLKETSF